MFKIFTEAEKSFWGAAKLSNLSNKSFTSLHVTNATRGTLEVLFLSHALSSFHAFHTHALFHPCKLISIIFSLSLPLSVLVSLDLSIAQTVNLYLSLSL